MPKPRLKGLLERLPFLADERGALNAVEFAFALPVIGLLSGGIVDIGMVMWRATTLEHVAHEGARYASVRGLEAFPTSMIIDPLEASDIDAFKNYVKSLAIGIAPADLTVNIAWDPVNENAKGDKVIVSVSYQYDAIMGGFFGFGPIDIAKSSTMTIM